jgi:hypothetical protein
MTQVWIAGVVRLLFTLLVTGAAMPTGPSAVRSGDVEAEVEVEEDDKTTTSSAHALRQSKRGGSAKSRFTELEVPSTLQPTRAAAQPQTWMRPRRMPLSDDEAIA